MRVLHAISGLRSSAGGTVAAMVALAGAQRAAGARVSILSTFIEPETDRVEEVRRLGLDVHSVGPCRDPLSRHPELAPTALRLAGDADAVHIHGLWEDVQHRAAVGAHELGVPYVVSPHGMLDPWSLRQGKWKKRAYLALRLRRDLKRAAAIHFTSRIERDLAAALRLRGPEAIVEPNGLDLAEFADLPARGALRARHPQLQDRKIVLFLGRLHEKKGFDLLIPAIEQIGTDAALVIAGPDDGGYRRTIEDLVARHGIGDRTVFTGMLVGRSRIEAMVDADLFVLPSYQENFGIAVIESLAAGCPVIISDQVNIHPEITAAGVGAVVRTDASELAREIRRWLDDPALRAGAAARGPAFVREHYDLQRVAARWIDHYQRLPGKRRKGPVA